MKPPSLFLSLGSEARALLVVAWRGRLRGSAWLWMEVALAVLVLLLVIFQYDFPVARLTPIDNGAWVPGYGPAAEAFSFWGDYLTGTFIVSFGLIGAGLVAKRETWRRAGLAALLAATLAGIPGSTLRLTLGRPRPSATAAEAAAQLHRASPAEVVPLVSFGRSLRPSAPPDGFYGPHPTALLQGFPSGHATTSMATASALLVALPEIGIPATIGAIGVCWSRAWLGRHYLSDLVTGATLGLAFGLPLGAAARRRNEVEGGAKL